MVELFSIQMNLPPDVEAEIDYQGRGAAEPSASPDILYRESYIPNEGHFPLLCEELIRATSPPKPDQTNFAGALQEELSQLRRDGVLGNVVLLRESIYVLVKQKLDSGEFSSPMQCAFSRSQPGCSL
jgi:hypothetical protein